ncbi:MAG: restriction endonuclease subunit S [Ktedonobacteraceae bacterium]
MTQTKPQEATSFTSKWKTYPAYKDSGVEWLGEIPEHWEIWKIAHAFKQIGSGTTPLTSHEDYYEGDIPWVNTSELRDGPIFDTAKKLTKRALLDLTPLRIYPPGTLLVALYGATIGKVGILEIPATTNQACCALSELNYLSVKFAFYWFLAYRQQLILLASGGSQPNISQDIIRSLRISAPPLPEQCAISSFLDRETAKINTLVAKKERLIELLQERRSALISHAVTKGLDPTVKMKDSGVEWLGEIPEHWEVRRLKYIASILRGKFSHRPRNDPRMYDGPYPFIQTGDITATTKYITSYQQTLNETGFAVSKQFPSRTLVMTIAANIGDLAILQFPACFPDSIVGFVPTPDVALDYLYYNLTSMKPEMMSTATLNTQLNLNVERIGGLITACPPIREQITIASYLEHETAKIDALISRIRDGIEKLKEYSTALISAAVTGKIDVRGENVITEDEM